MTAVASTAPALRAPAAPRGPVVGYLVRSYVGWMLGTVLLSAGIGAGVALGLRLAGEQIARHDTMLMIGSVMGWSQGILIAIMVGLRTPALLTAGARRRDHLAALGAVSVVGLACDALVIAGFLVVEGFGLDPESLGIAVLLIAAFHVSGVLVPAAYLHLGGLLGTLVLPLTAPVLPVYLLSVDMGPRPGLAVGLALSLGWLVAAALGAWLLGRSVPASPRLV